MFVLVRQLIKLFFFSSTRHLLWCLAGATARHAVENGYRTILVEDACRGVDNDAIECTRQELVQMNAIIVHSSQVLFQYHQSSIIDTIHLFFNNKIILFHIIFNNNISL